MSEGVFCGNKMLSQGIRTVFKNVERRGRRKFSAQDWLAMMGLFGWEKLAAKRWNKTLLGEGGRDE